MTNIEKLFDKDLIEFRKTILDQDVDEYQHPLLYQNIKCSDCSKEQNFYSAMNNGWWIDEFFVDCRDSNKLQDLCLECRNEAQIKHDAGLVKCARCTRYGEEYTPRLRAGETDKFALCYSEGVDQIFCYDCHSLIHYIK